jgi:hypothetical protein
MNIQHVGIAHGWQWLIRGFALFRKSPVMWIVFVLILYLAAQIALQIPLLGVLLMLFYPLLLAGLMLGCRDLEQGKALATGHLLAGLRQHPGRLVTIGGINIAAQLVIGFVMYAVGGPELRLLLSASPETVDPNAVAQAANRLMVALSLGTLLSIPLLMAVWFAPLLVVLRNQPPLQAMRLSFLGCLRNLVAFFSYGLLLLALIMLAMTPFGLINAQGNPGAWVVLPFLLPSIYAAYRDIFRDFA